MALRPVTLPLAGDRTIRAVLGVPRSKTMAAILVLAHGANNNMDYPLIAGLHEKLARQGLVTVRFNFPYAEEGRKRPDPDETLEGVYRLVLEYVAEMEEFKGLELSRRARSRPGKTPQRAATCPGPTRPAGSQGTPGGPSASAQSRHSARALQAWLA